VVIEFCFGALCATVEVPWALDPIYDE